MFPRAIVGAVLKVARQARKVRQGELADELGMSQAALSHIEAGRNAASQKVLEAYARRVVGPSAAPEFIEMLNSGSPSSLTRLAELVAPSNPQDFEKTIERIVSSKRESVTRTKLNAAEVRDVRLQSISSLSPREDRPSSFDERDRVMRALRSYITDRGGRVLFAGRDSSDFGLGFPMKCDLIETTRSLVIEVRSSNRFESRFVPEIVGKTVMLQEHGFQYVLCFTSPPVSRLDNVTIDVARRYGAFVIWAESLLDNADENPVFSGDKFV